MMKPSLIRRVMRSPRSEPVIPVAPPIPLQAVELSNVYLCFVPRVVGHGEEARWFVARGSGNRSKRLRDMAANELEWLRSEHGEQVAAMEAAGKV